MPLRLSSVLKAQRYPHYALFLALSLPLLAIAPRALAAEEGPGGDSIVTDRPDFVESSNVVGKGRFQVETSFAVERNKGAGIRERTVSTPTLLRYGTGEDVEIRLETDGRMSSRTESGIPVVRSTLRGYSDASIGVKWHTQDGEGSTPSVGFLLHADLDSGSAPFRGEGVRLSLRMAAEWELPNALSLGMMPGLARGKNDAGAHFTSGIFGIVLGRSWTEQLRSFVELSAPQIASSRNGGTIATFDIGGAYLLSPRCQVDTALSRGLNKRTADLSWTVGVSFKL